jgi:hypothetical protein
MTRRSVSTRPACSNISSEAGGGNDRACEIRPPKSADYVASSLRTEALLIFNCLANSRFDDPVLNSSLILSACSVTERGLP